jgi:hypothetical protein
MTRISLILALVIGTSAASAQPYPSQWQERDRYESNRDTRDHYRYDVNRHGRDFRGRWVPLAREYSARTDRQFINVQGRGGRFDKLVLKGERGAPVINKVAIEFAGNPNTQVVTLQERLPAGEAEVINLNGNQRINRIIVYTEPRFGGSYSVFGT